MGIIAASIPIMKPLIRYIRARLSGHDPYNILVRSRSHSVSSTHFHWYHRLLNSSSYFQSHRRRSSDPKSGRDLKPGPYWKPVMTPKVTQGQSTGETISLPMQGIIKTTDTNVDIESRGRDDSTQNLRIDFSRTRRWKSEDNF